MFLKLKVSGGADDRDKVEITKKSLTYSSHLFTTLSLFNARLAIRY